jgi:hypothetical protein
MTRSRSNFKYFTYVALLLMALPLMGGWKVCPKKAKKQGIIQTSRLILPAEAVSSPGANGDSLDNKGKPRCACKKGKSCPGIPQVILASGRSLSRVEQSPDKNTTQSSCLGNPCTSLFAAGPPGGCDTPGFRNVQVLLSELHLTTVLLI